MTQADIPFLQDLLKDRGPLILDVGLMVAGIPSNVKLDRASSI